MNARLSRLFLSFTFALAALAAPGFAQTTFVATLEAGQVVGGTSSPATGSATMVLDAAKETLTYSIVLDLDLDGQQTVLDPGDDVSAFHFHAAPPGSNGGVAFGMISPNHDADDLVIDPAQGTLNGIWEETDSVALSTFLATLESGGLYLNVHTGDFPGGAIRGQVEPIVFADRFEAGNLDAWDASVP